MGLVRQSQRRALCFREDQASTSFNFRSYPSVAIATRKLQAQRPPLLEPLSRLLPAMPPAFEALPVLVDPGDSIPVRIVLDAFEASGNNDGDTEKLWRS